MRGCRSLYREAEIETSPFLFHACTPCCSPLFSVARERVQLTPSFSHRKFLYSQSKSETESTKTERESIRRSVQRGDAENSRREYDFPYKRLHPISPPQGLIFEKSFLSAPLHPLRNISSKFHVSIFSGLGCALSVSQSVSQSRNCYIYEVFQANGQHFSDDPPSIFLKLKYVLVLPESALHTNFQISKYNIY